MFFKLDIYKLTNAFEVVSSSWKPIAIFENSLTNGIPLNKLKKAKLQGEYSFSFQQDY